MKQSLHFMVVPKSFWDNEQLSIAAKWVAITIDSYTDNPTGVAMGIKALQTATNLTANEVKAALVELMEHNAIDVTIGPDGEKLIKPYLYKERYVKRGEKVVIGDKPTDVETIDYDNIQETWNNVCSELPKLDRFTARRKQKTRTCLKGASATEADMIKVIKLVAASSFLNGKRTDWQCTYDWIIKSPDNFTKIFEGQYHKDYAEKQAYEAIMRGGNVEQPNTEDDYYR